MEYRIIGLSNIVLDVIGYWFDSPLRGGVESLPAPPVPLERITLYHSEREDKMDISNYTEYEIVVPETNQRFFIKERYEALAYLKDACMVFEHHVTIHNPTPHFQTRMIITRPWHNNPDFREED